MSSKNEYEDLTMEQIDSAVQMIFMDDKEYYNQFLAELTEEEFARFLKKCPEFLEDMDLDSL